MEDHNASDEEVSKSPVRDEGNEEGNDEEHNEKAQKEEEEENNNPTISASTLSTFNGTSLPYDLSTLTWDSGHRNNKQNVYCYCGKPKTNDSPMYSCEQCSQWFHLECLKEKPNPFPLRGDAFYKFKCSLCCNGGSEAMTIVPNKSWIDIVRITLWNLVLQERQKDSSRVFFQYKEQICKFIDANWKSVCGNKERTKTWENTVGSSLSTKIQYFISGQPALPQGFWGLKNNVDPTDKKAVEKRKTAQGGAAKSKKKKTDAPGEVKRKKIPVKTFTGAQFFHPCNYNYDAICVAKENTALEVKIEADRMTVSNQKGYRTARASFGASEGSWYFEILVLEHSGNTRLGWSTEKGYLEAPVGYDQYSYSYRDKEGTSFSQSHGHPYGNPYGPKDIIGCLIELPNISEEDAAKSEQTETAAATSGAAATTSAAVNGGKLKEKIHPKSKVSFFKNGADQGVAFTNVFQGNYFPAASMYGGAKVQFNFGPSFRYPPPSSKNSRPICEVAPIVIEKEKQRLEKEEAELEAKEDTMDIEATGETTVVS